MKKIILLVCILSILITPNISSAKDSTEYKVVGDKQFPPYEYVDNDGNFKGFNVDMMKAISLVSGMEFEFIPMKWDDAYHAIDNGTADIIQGMKESGLRREKFLFSESLLVNSQSIFVLAENKSIYGIRDLKDKKVAINIQDMNYNDSNNFGNIDAIEYESLSDALNALLNEEVDALIGNTLTINYLCKENNSIDKVQIVGEAINESKYSIAVGKNRGDLLDKLDKAILELQIHRVQSTWEELRRSSYVCRITRPWPRCYTYSYS